MVSAGSGRGPSCGGSVVVVLGMRIGRRACLGRLRTPPRFGILACGVDGVDDGVGEGGVADYLLVVH